MGKANDLLKSEGIDYKEKFNLLWEWCDDFQKDVFSLMDKYIEEGRPYSRPLDGRNSLADRREETPSQ